MSEEITLSEFYYALKVLENNLSIKVKAIKVGDSVLKLIMKQLSFIPLYDYKRYGITPVYPNEVGMFSGMRIIADSSLKDWMFTIIK